MSRYAETIIKDSMRLLAAFGLTRENATNDPKTFPYGFTQEDMEGVFRQMCPNYDSYQEFLDHYRRNIHAIERSIKTLKTQMVWTNAVEVGGMDIPDMQSVKARLGNLATYLIWLRRAGRAWRRNTKEALKQE